MIVIKVELWPYGDPKGARTISIGVIANDGTGGLEVGNYNVCLTTQGRRGIGGKFYKGRVEGFRRLDDSVWSLIRQGIESSLSGGSVAEDDPALAHVMQETVDKED